MGSFIFMYMSERFTIQDWAPVERPREKFLEKGAESLSDAELLAILIRSGNRNENAIDLARKILAAAENNLRALRKFSYKDYRKFCSFRTVYCRNFNVGKFLLDKEDNNFCKDVLLTPFPYFSNNS